MYSLDAIYAGLEDLVCSDLPVADSRAIDSSGGHTAYGELTIRGGQAVIKMFGLTAADVLYDLGSGASKFIVQACLAIPGCRGVGVELAPSRHAVAAAAAARPAWPPLASVRLDDMMTTPMDDCTHAYLATLTFDDDFMEKLGARLAALPRLQTIATLKRFPAHEMHTADREDAPRFTDVFCEDEEARRTVEVTWGVAVVHVYRRRRSNGGATAY